MKPFTIYDPSTGDIAYSGSAADDQPVPAGMAIIYSASGPDQRVNIDDPAQPFIDDIPVNRRRQPQPPDDPKRTPYPSRAEFDELLARVAALEKSAASR